MLAAGTRLGPYEVLAPLGAGGMGEVYRARDTKLGREVALKILPESFARDPERRARFEREAQLLASLNHTNIGAIYGLEEANALRFLVLELVPGKTLAERLTSGRVEVEEALSIAHQIAEALEAAHDKGIIHRDLKPGNVKLTPEGKVKVLDFGLAKAFTSESAEVDLSKSPTITDAGTRQGVILGTAAYMSPEQARGKPLDRRTDIWSFGCVLYELLTGKQAFAGATISDTMAAILTREPGWESLPAKTTASIQALLRRCLQKDASRRLQHIGDARIELEEALAKPATQPTATQRTPADQPRWRSKAVWAIGGVALAGLLALGTWFAVFRGRGEAIDSIAVLPFVNASGDANTEYLSDGITESLINSLSQLPHLRVMARSTVSRFKGKETDSQKVGQQLGVRAVLSGRLLQRSDNLTVGVELMEVEKGSQLWGEQYTRKPSDILALQEEISQKILDKLRLRLSGEQKKQLTKRYTDNSEAYHLYLKGRYYWNKRTAQGLKKSTEYFEQAIEKDPGYALAYSGLADTYDVLPFYSVMTPKEAYPKAKTAALKALEIDDRLAEAHTSLAYAMWNYDWDWARAEQENKRSIELNPNYANGHHWYGLFLIILGRHGEAVRELKRAVNIDSLSLIINTKLGVTYYYGREYGPAVDQLRKTTEMDPRFPPAHLYLGLCYEQLGKFQEAITEFQKGLELGENPWFTASLIHAYGRSGRRVEAQQQLQKLLEAAKTKFVSPYFVATAYAGLGDKDKAFQWLETAYRDRVDWMTYLKVDPALDPLRNDSRFQDLLRRIGLPP